MTAGASLTRLPGSASEYYADPSIRERMLEYCGATDGRPPSSAYLVGIGPGHGPFPSWEQAEVVPPTEMERFWSSGCDISRALWDERSLIFVVDLDYQNPDQPSEPYLRPAEVFVKLEPAYRAVRSVLAGYDLHPLAVMTGRGYHFTGHIPLESSAISRLAGIARGVPGWYHSVERRRRPGVTTAMTERHAAAAFGLGLLLEFIAHDMMRIAQRESQIPVVLNGTIVGSGRLGRECVSIDFSYAGDPLDVRHFRVLFSTYQWHRMRPDIFGWLASSDVPPLVTLPRTRVGLLRMLERGHGFAAGLALARVPAPMPDVSLGVAAAIDAYEASPLAAFHRDFLDRRTRHPGTVAAPDTSLLPPCVVAPLDRPNDLLLKPAHIQHLVRGLMARGWDPADVAVLVGATYRQDHHWGTRWSWMDADTRADFDVRVFAGLLATGHDALIDFNCVSAQEKDLCPRMPCARDLRDERDCLRLRLEDR
jgi:hypothetical protein